MRVQAFPFNPFAENTYLIIADNGDCAIVDPGMCDEREQAIMTAHITENKLNLRMHLLTHAHIDHVLGCDFVEKKYKLKPRAHADSVPVWASCEQVAKMYAIPYLQGSEPTYDIKAGVEIELGGESIEVRYVPGHAPGHVVFISHADKWVIAGDTLFQGSIGRTDLPGGDTELLLSCIREELFSLDDDYSVHPGHGPATSIGEEKRENPFF